MYVLKEVNSVNMNIPNNVDSIDSFIDELYKNITIE